MTTPHGPGPVPPSTPPHQQWGSPQPAAPTQGQHPAPQYGQPAYPAPAQPAAQPYPELYGSTEPAPAPPAPAAQQTSAPPPGFGPPQPPAPTRAPGNPGAALGWIGAVVGLLLGFVGIVMGAISISRSRKAGASKVPGIIAVVVGALQAVTIVTVVLVLVANGTFASLLPQSNAGDVDEPRDVTFAELTLGNCLDDFYAPEPLLHVPCSTPHNAEVVHTFEAPGTAYPGSDALEEQADDVCYDEIAAAIPIGTDTTNLYYDFWYPSIEAWDGGERTVGCALLSDGAEMTGSATANTLEVS